MSNATEIIEQSDMSAEIVDLLSDPDWKDIVFESYMNQDRDSDYVDGKSKGASVAQSHRVGRRRHLRVASRG